MAPPQGWEVMGSLGIPLATQGNRDHNLPTAQDAFLSVPLSLTYRWRFLALGVR